MNITFILISAFIGTVLGIIGSRFLFVGSWLSLIPWGVIGVILGLRSKKQRDALVSGLVYGFFLSFSFMLSGYSGSASIISRIPFFTLLGLFGAVCGFVLTLAGFYLKNVRKAAI